MRDYTAATYGDRIADDYDQLYQGVLDTDSAVATLVKLAAGGSVLELGVGTGRLALPLAEQGIPVSGIDASEAMVAKLRSKPGGDRIPITIGDFAGLPDQGLFSLVFAAANTFFGLLSQEEQVRCFQSVAEHLATNGVFAIEVFVPDGARLAASPNARALQVDLNHVLLSVGRHDPIHQRIEGQTISLTPEGVRLYPGQIRYAWPSELDLMARLANLRLSKRWANWHEDPFTVASMQHVSVYARMSAQ